jgi:hypothetical protein
MTDPADASTRTSTAAAGNVATASASTQGVIATGNASPFVFAPGDHIDLEVDTVAAPVATFLATAGARTGVGGTWPTLFGGGETLELALDSGATQTLVFAAGDQALADVIDKINVLLVGGFADENAGQLRITSDKKGTGSKVAIIGGSGRATLGLAIADTSGTGNVADITEVSGVEFKTVVELATTAEVTVNGDLTCSIRTPTVGAGGSIKVAAASTVDDAAKCDLDNLLHSGTAAGPGTTAVATAKSHGTWGDDLAVVISAASSGVATEFNLAITESAVVKESFINLTMLTTSAYYAELVLNATNTGSSYITWVDSHTGVAPANRPTNGSYPLTGGGDGLASLAEIDFYGSSTGSTGFYSLDAVENLTLLLPAGRTSAALQQEATYYAETWRKKQVFAVLDSPAGYTASQMKTHQVTTAALYERSDCAAIYWPRVKIPNPAPSILASDANGNVTAPACGAVAGMMARTDGTLNGGVHQPPAGPERGILYGVVDLESQEAFDQNKRDLLYPVNVNCLTAWSGVQIHVDGNRCLKTSGNWGYVSERRGVSYILRRLKIGLAFVRHANINTALRRRAYKTSDSILAEECAGDAFLSRNPAAAYRIDFSAALNTAATAKQHKFYGQIKIAKAKSVDWAIIDVSENGGEFDVNLQND